MNIILLREADFTDPGHVILSDRRAGHILTTLRAAEGDTLFCGLINGKTGQGRITQIRDGTVKMAVALQTPPPPALPLILVLALPRPKAARRIIETAACLGIKQIYLINAWRVEKSFWQSPVLTAANLKKAMICGLEQAKDTMMPAIQQKRFFTPFVKTELPGIARHSRPLVAHPGADTPCPVGVDTQTTLVIGPEGGFIDIEIRTLEEIGFETVRLGDRIMRTETALPFAVSRLFPHLF